MRAPFGSVKKAASGTHGLRAPPTTHDQRDRDARGFD